MGGNKPVVFGARLRHLRESRRVSLRDIADETKISVRTLEALESDDIARLPAGIFSRAIVRAYAAAIGADPETTVEEFIARFAVDPVVAEADHQRSDEEAPRPSLAVIAAVAVPVVALLVWSFLA